MKKNELILSEDQARRLWERAAQLQTEAKERERAAEVRGDSGKPKRRLLTGQGDESTGYSLSSVKEAGLEVGIQPDFLEVALAEEAILELEGGGKSGFWDKTSEKFLAHREPALDLRQHYSFPPRLVWLAIEDAFISDTHGLDLLEIRGGDPDEGGIAIFESPYTYQASGSLRYWATVAEIRRFMVQVEPDEDGGCVAVIRAPLRRSRRVNGAVGMAVAGVGGALGGGLGLGMAGLVAGATGLAALPVGLGLLALGALGGEGLSRFGYIKMYRWGFRALERALRKILTRVERDLQRDQAARALPGS